MSAAMRARACNHERSFDRECRQSQPEHAHVPSRCSIFIELLIERIPMSIGSITMNHCGRASGCYCALHEPRAAAPTREQIELPMVLDCLSDPTRLAIVYNLAKHDQPRRTALRRFNAFSGKSNLPTISPDCGSRSATDRIVGTRVT